MHVGYDARILASGQLTGIGRYARHLLGAVGKTGGGHLLTLFYPLGVPAPEPLPGFGSRRGWVPGGLRESRFLHLWFDLYLPFEIARRRIRIFHGPSYLIPSTRRAKTVVTVHDLAHEKCRGWAPGCSAEFMRRARRDALRADAVIAVSRATQRDVAAIWGVPEERIEVIHEGVDPTFRPLDDPGLLDAYRARRGLPAHYILSVLSLTPRKNLPGLMRAFSLFRRSSGLPHHLVVAGKSYGAPDPRRLAEELGIADRFLFISYVPAGELPLLYNAADIFAFPSFYEGFGLPAVEALACGCPVVSSHAGSLPEVLGDAARYFDPADCAGMAREIEAAAREGREPARRERGLGRARGYTWERAARETMRLYERLL